MVIADPDGDRPGAPGTARTTRAASARARPAARSLVDTTLRLGHVGSYTYGWEDAGQAVPRVTGARFRYGPGGVVDE